MYYGQKIIRSGDYLELYKYEKIQKRDFTRKKKHPLEINKPEIEPSAPEQLTIDDFIKTEKTEKIKQLIKRSDSIARTRTEIRRLINSNPDLSKFYTLTFKENVTDVEIANKFFNKFIMKMNYHYGDFVYVSIIEFQHRGAVHYHFLCNLPYIESNEVADLWKHGFIKINRIKHVTNLGAYVCKYLQKDMTDERLFNKKKYFCSKNIKRPLEIYDRKIIEKIILQYNLDCIKPDYETNFENEYTGKVKYEQFKLKSSTA
jgi:hypothetical protein